MQALKEWFAKRWLWVAGFFAGVVALVVVRSQGKQAGRLEVVKEDMQDALGKVDQARKPLEDLHQERVDLATKITREAAARTKALEEDLSPEEVLKRLREKGLVK